MCKYCAILYKRIAYLWILVHMGVLEPILRGFKDTSIVEACFLVLFSETRNHTLL